MDVLTTHTVYTKKVTLTIYLLNDLDFNYLIKCAMIKVRT